MAQYDPITGHTLSPHRNFGEDFGDDVHQREYAVNCEDIVSYRVTAADKQDARTQARRMFRAEAGRNPVWCIATRTGATA